VEFFCFGGEGGGKKKKRLRREDEVEKEEEKKKARLLSQLSVKGKRVYIFSPRFPLSSCAFGFKSRSGSQACRFKLGLGGRRGRERRASKALWRREG